MGGWGRKRGREEVGMQRAGKGEREERAAERGGERAGKVKRGGWVGRGSTGARARERESESK